MSDLRQACIATLLVFAGAMPAAAQLARPARVAIDSVVAVDEAVDTNGNNVTGLIADAVASVDLGSNLQFITRPYVQRTAASGEWNAQVWVAALRYERAGPVGVRIDAGYIPSPIGLANLLLRPHVNPTIAQPSSLFASLPSPVVRGPRTNLLGAVYPTGVSVTASTASVDVRAAVIDSSPLRTRRVFADFDPPNPPRFLNTVVGGGVTPFVGFRLGASVAHGGWLKAGESPVVTTDRNATIVTVESEFAYRYTKVLGEWVRDRLDTDTGAHVAHGFFLQAQQTLAPRWFVAGRVERIATPVALPAGTFRNDRLTGVEETLGYRLTSDVTLRFSHRARQSFGAGSATHTAAVSVVWWKRIL